MRAEATRLGGRFIRRQRQDAQSLTAEAICQDAIEVKRGYPLMIVARIEPAALMLMASICNVTVKDFAQRYQ